MVLLSQSVVSMSLRPASSFHNTVFRIAKRQKRTRSSSRSATKRLRAQQNKSIVKKEFGKEISRKHTNSKRPTIKAVAKEPFLFKSPLAWYSHKLETHPLMTKCLSSGFIAGSGDLLCQYLVHKNQEDFTIDWVRTGRFTLLGFGLVAPVVHVWYGSLGKRFPGTTIQQVAKRLLFDQAFFAPLFLPTFLLNLNMLEGRPPNEVLSKLQTDLPAALVTNWCLWIPAQVINFRFVPIKYQVLFSNMVGFAWNAYLSWRTQEEHGG